MSPSNESGIKIFKVANRLIKKLGVRADGRVPTEIDPEKIAEAEKLIAGMCETSPETLANNLKKINEQWEKMQALTMDELNRGLGDWVGEKEKKAMLLRRDLMAKNIQELVAKRGEAFVFYD